MTKLKQLLARSRYLLYKSQDKWTQDQKDRGRILLGSTQT
ncbi:transposase [Haoranjiania flava]|uniref:Transposase n=1 Tax=Haoranjiania flava TaxID=1856322 RepID=A0AAE3IML7_9BACT|nr:transposase [Haoranjiania flava]MCU7693830.1 transposase [Haoranjiania flava]